MNHDVESGRDGSEVNVNGASKETPSLIAKHKVEDEKEAMVRQDNTMGKQNAEDLDDDAQERMLKDESTAITEKDATEVRIIYPWSISFICLVNFISLLRQS